MEDQVLLDLIVKADLDIPIFTLDTGRLFPETYELLEENRKIYGRNISIVFPDAADVEAMVNRHGPNLFRQSVELRKECCRVRKLVPLKRALAGKEAWLCGLRREQSPTRSELEVVADDPNTGLIKVCPLAHWSTGQVWDYIREHNVPYNRLHDRGFPSIGCSCCTRAIKSSDSIRSGRWWWEKPEHRECGLHNRRTDTTQDAS